MSSREARRPSSPSADEPPSQSPAASNQHNSVTLGPRDRVIGQLYIEGDLRVGGIVEGEVEVTGDVAIDDMANVKASVTARDVSISGHLVGAVIARKRLEVTRSGSLIGDVRVARLTIQDGATFSGKVSMGAAAAAPAKASEPKLAASDPAPARPPEAKAVTADPQAQTVTGSPAPTVPASAAQAIAPTPAAKASSVAPPAAKAPVAAAPAAKMPTIPTSAGKAPTVPAPAAAAPSSGKDGKAKGLPPKGKPKRR